MGLIFSESSLSQTRNRLSLESSVVEYNGEYHKIRTFLTYLFKEQKLVLDLAVSITLVQSSYTFQNSKIKVNELMGTIQN